MASLTQRWIEVDRGYAIDGLVSPCWVWTHNVHPVTGYSQAWSPRHSNTRPGHVVVWERIHGPVPEHLTLDHRCRVRSCVNPAHLEICTMAENVRRGRSTPLTWEDVDEIRSSVGITQQELGVRFGVCQSTIAKIRQGQTWKPESRFV